MVSVFTQWTVFDLKRSVTTTTTLIKCKPIHFPIILFVINMDDFKESTSKILHYLIHYLIESM